MASHISAMNTTLLPRRLRLRDPHGTSQAGEASSAVASLAVSRRTLPATIALNRSVNPVPAAKPSLASLWKEIQGSGDWEDMVEPLNLLLRNEIVRYGEFVLATYKAFDLDPASKRYLNCKYGKSNMLRESGFGDLGYEVTKYIYAAPDITLPTQSQPFGSRWIGYVAVSSDAEVARLGRRDIVVSFRGTVTTAEWLANFMNSLTPARLDPHNPRPDVKVQSGFLSVYTSGDSTCKFSHGSCREQLLSELSRIINMYKNEELSITLAGHSMGSSLALLLGYDLSELGLNRDASNRVIPTTVYSFGGPRVGNSGFKERCEELGVKVLRVVNVKDPVTKLPGVLLNENFRVLGGKFELPWSCSCYAHVGVELALDFFKMKDPVCVHDLDAYLGLLKCPKIARAQKNGSDLFDKAMRLMVAPGFDTCWNDAAKNVRNLVQSMRICDLTPWLQSR